ncbi:MAG: glycosyltransferase family 2 protein [Prevotella sp.]|nr:glycosyltransferase family 2 protein [Prevotella sp.]
MKVLAIIISYHFMPWVDKCLPSLQSSTYPVDVMVLDNGSKDESVEHVRCNYPDVTVVDNQVNLGFGKANNIGIHYAMEKGYDAVLLINQDAWLDNDALGKLVEVLENHPEYGIVSPIHKNGAGDKVERGFAAYTGVNDLQHLPQDTVVEVPFINAAIWLVRVETLRKTGAFAPLFYHYGEDKDLANRMAYHHYKIGYVPAAFGCHDREFREMGKEKFFWTEYVFHLSEYANINHSCTKAFAHGVLAVMKKALVATFHGRWGAAAAYAKVAWRLLSRTNDVAKTRKMARNSAHIPFP